MNEVVIIGNWKSNKTIDEAIAWFTAFQDLLQKEESKIEKKIDIIIALPYLHIDSIKKLLVKSGLAVKLAAQNVSPFPDGAYTGEVSARMLKGLVEFCLIGHSERRNLFGETDEDIAQKAKLLKESGIEPVLCIQSAETPIPETVKYVAYEPVWAIGSGKPATPVHAQEIAFMFKKRYPNTVIIYGGSVTPDNVSGFISQPDIHGVLPGGASLQANSFFQIIVHAQNQS